MHTYMFRNYSINGMWDEFFQKPGTPHTHLEQIWRDFQEISQEDYSRLHNDAVNTLIRTGITFLVYGDEQGSEKIMPFDLIPRILAWNEWHTIEQGLIQRITALNLFINDLYHGQQILKDNILPKELVLSSTALRPECQGLNPPKDIWIHVTGTDLIRDEQGNFLVLEDNLRCPSGVSYVLENRELVKRAFPRMFERAGVLPVESYPDMLFDLLEYISPRTDQPRLGVLTPGIYNSAYFEHSFLARKMGVELVQGQDLVVENGKVYVKTTSGLEQVDGLYRRIDDDFMDPLTFRKDSLIGVPGLMDAYKKGNIALANAPGTGIADDKAVYAYVPEIIKYYLDQDPILQNVPTYLCSRDKELTYVLANLDRLVVKAVNESGGYGMLMGHQATQEQRDEFAEKIKANPRMYIAQPVVDLSQAPTYTQSGFEGRRVDLRPYVLYGKDIKIIPGGLTRVALKEGSLVVNSSQGGGSKDTWVLSPRQEDRYAK
jgi:uncharacterized circularly permuted ATP-grasp superfamily protein